MTSLQPLALPSPPTTEQQQQDTLKLHYDPRKALLNNIKHNHNIKHIDSDYKHTYNDNIKRKNNNNSPNNNGNIMTTSPRARVTRPPNAFLLFNKEMRKRLKIDNPTWTVAEISKEISERWKTLSLEERGQYLLQANKIKENQQALHPNAMYIRRSKAELTEAGHYEKVEQKKRITAGIDLITDNATSLSSPSSSDHTSKSINQQPVLSSSSSPLIKKRVKKKKDPKQPKHPLSAYMWFLTEVRPKTRQLHPKLTVGQISKLCADQWNAMEEHQKLPWIEKATNDKARYAREMFFYANQNTHHPLGRGTRQKYRSYQHQLQQNLTFNPIPSPPQQQQQQQQEQHHHNHHQDMILNDSNKITEFNNNDNSEENQHHHMQQQQREDNHSIEKNNNVDHINTFHDNPSNDSSNTNVS
ncbi:high mobility group box domain-containing protein [Cunninghamella echinulata]|nr:high mobility group box domain-containing protein [Cunninghamella echinulata]